MGPNGQPADSRRQRGAVAVILIALASWGFFARLGHGQNALSENEARLKKMTPDQKDELRKKKVRFDELSDEEKGRLRDLHQSITSDPNSTELIETVKNYNRWLANLDSTERSTLLDIKDPAQRIARIKELMQQQEERRFRQYFANLSEADRKAIYQWLGDFVAKHADAIIERMPPSVRQRIADATDVEAKRRELLAGWQWRRRDLPNPAASDYAVLFQRFSAETQKAIESAAANALTAEPEEQRTPERQRTLQQQRMEELVRTAIYSRVFQPVSEEELLKFYAEMKPDDRRRKDLDGKEGLELRRELQRMYNMDRLGGRGGPSGQGGRGPGPGGWIAPPPSGRGDGRGGFRPEDRGGKPPPEAKP